MDVRIRCACLVSGALLSVIGCSKDEPEQKSFGCAQVQARAETCAPQTLARVKADLASRKDHAQQYEMFRLRFERRLAAKKPKAQCEKFRADPTRASRVEAMKSCYQKPDCEAFAACMLQL